MAISRVTTDKAPAAIGPYAQAVRAGEFLFCSGQIPLDPATGEVVTGDIRSQARRVMANLQGVLAAAGLGWADLVKTTIFLTDLGDFAAVNEVYGEFCGATPPARSTVQVAALPKGVAIEVEAVAYCGQR